MLKEKEVSTLYCEASFQEADKDKAVKFQHCTAKDAATVAKKTETVKYLIIGHISARYGSPEGSVKEAREVFAQTYHATKDMVFDIH
jgi:ribonuclease Z